MWADNETSVDLLGFDYLADMLEIVLTDERLLPLTVGVTGDWGSGKSSLLQITRERLESEENRDRFICVSFNPGRFEGYQDVKTSLMTAVIGAIAGRVDQDAGLKGTLGGLITKLRTRIAEMGLAGRASVLLAQSAGLGPEVGALVGTAADALMKPPAEQPGLTERQFETIARFHEEFAQLMDRLEGVQALVVFIDDMDRCEETDTIVETFAAIRLFLHGPKTAYVIGARPEIIQAAIEERYPATREGETSLGRNYLEKILQTTIAVPALGEAEARSYMHLLFAEALLDEEQFEKLRSAAASRRVDDPFGVAMNEGIAREALGEMPDELAEAFELTDRIGSLLTRGLRGNPRELKRFLNDFTLRRRTAKARGLTLEPGVLVKLMLLEHLHPTDFEKIFIWESAADAPSPELAIAEDLARGKDVEGAPDGVSEWMSHQDVKQWLLLEPALARLKLSPYFTFSRDKLAAAVGASVLSPKLQQLLGKLRSDIRAARAQALADVSALEPHERDALVDVLLPEAIRDVSGDAMRSALDLAKEVPGVADALLAALQEMPVRRASAPLVPKLRLAYEDARLESLFAKWNAEGSPALKRAIAPRAGKGR
ncbi:MAG: P-loop NTPase fold protein [Dehalococcoidia bacterium]